MKKLFAVLFCALIVIGCNNNSYEIDPVATAKAPWKLGEKIVEDGRCEDADFYRKFLGITKSGLALVQDFYLSGEKFSDPFLTTVANAGEYATYLCVEDVEGKYIQWHKNGQKMGEANYTKGRAEAWTSWYETGKKRSEGDYRSDSGESQIIAWHENGQKWLEGRYKNDKKEGLARFWHKNGHREAEGNYKNDREVGIWRYWDEKGNLTRERDFGTPKD